MRGRNVTLVLALAAIPAPAAGQEQIKPYFMLIFDNSGSMDGNPLTQAKTAVSNIVNSTGDAVFGLERFRRSCGPGSTNCPSCSGGCSSYNDGEILVPIYEDNQEAILVWIDGTCDFDTGQYELSASGYTPIANSLDEAQDYYEAGVDNVWGPYWPSPIELDQDADPPVDQCRPYAVILLTDGSQTCSGNPVTEATQLRSTTVNGEVYDVRTYVIGFRINPGDTEIEDIAEAGGTDSPDPLYRGFYPQDDVDLALALSQIIQDSLLVEVCNGVDDDCDQLVDEGVTNACGTCGPLVEACNGLDDDCDGQTDEGFQLFCDRPNDHFAQDLCADPGETVCDGVDDNCDGAIDIDDVGGDICDGCVPSGEICDAIDNDCDGAIDDGLTRPCGTDVGECSRGIETCAAGVWGACSGQGPVAEQCNGLDDDCNGVADGMVEVCGTDEGECQAGARRCEDGNWGDCVGDVPPTDEICDGLDNDCDGVPDDGDPGGGAGCGSDEGECVSGVYACQNGELVCAGVGPTPELCDTLDNDCDGEVDEDNPGGGGPCGYEDEGDCSDGVLQCIEGEIDCVGWQGPSEEVCDGLDNDCDGEADEDLQIEGPCGTDEGECEGGTLACVEGDVICEGEVPPSEEICDGLDNDCDGGIDEGLPVGDPCGTDVGECEPGVWVCADGQLVCEGETGPGEEECNGLDDDCDSEIDEGLGLGEECGTEIGLCVPGMSQCLEGGVVCAGGTPPQNELCDCEDNDCDGEVDENPDDICPPGARCIDCDCSSPCSAEQEFPCPPGRQCIDGWCIGNRCSGVNCPEGERCIGGSCVSRCEGVACEAGLRCSDGACLVDDCFSFPEDCTDAETCIGGECAPHPCEGVACGDAEYCRAGDCVATCVGVACAEGQKCVDGGCETDRCAGVDCNERRFCDPESGTCIDDECVNVNCPAGHVCEPRTGDCLEDPCSLTRCPAGQVCEKGLCDMPRQNDEPGADAGVGKRIFATGGGGLVCSASGAGLSGRGLGWLATLVAALAVAVRRRRGRASALAGWREPGKENLAQRRKDAKGRIPVFMARSSGRRECLRTLAALRLCESYFRIRTTCLVRHVPRAASLLAAFAAVFALAGCEVDPYCLDCPSASLEGVDGAVDAGWITYDGGGRGEGGPGDGGEPDGCTPGAPELCNEHDDDCDGDIDEGVDMTSPAHCGSCDNVCNLPHTFPSCTDGVCGIDRCDVGFSDLDGDIANGCEYGCLPTGEEDDDCDGQDDDCDGQRDEDVDLETDADNCGECGLRCRYPHGTGECVGGECRLASCDDGFYDDDEDAATGCEYSCGPPTEETCNGRDDDCDGDVDDGDPEGGAACGSDVGECERGVERCQGGRIVCDGEIAPADELCNLADDDCDDEIDEDDPEGGSLCGTNEGDCVAGRITCMAGDLVCVGEVPAVDEECDAHDNDCDGNIDEGNPGGGAACGSDVGACAEGAERCVGGVLVCEGGTGPRIESCNGVDDDCDDDVDEGFDFDEDLDNCGGCGIECEFENAYAACNDGACELFACRSGFVDRNGDPDDGCEVECELAGAEVCNGRDDDCNGEVDDGLVQPPNFCNPNGACANTSAECEGSDGWVCHYGPAVQQDADGNIVPETRCDGVDNDCDGLVDEADPLKGTPCFNGVGICRRDGVYICDPNDAEAAVICNAPPAGDPGTESCNGLDDDCDGDIDDDITDDMVQVNANLWVFRYEASRPDATVDDGGAAVGRACSAANVLPWTDVTWDEADDACAEAGKRLCIQAEWQDICNSTTNNCLWSYDATPGFACQPASAYNGTTCNGNNYDFDPLTAGDQDGLLPTAFLTHCGSDQLAGGGLDLAYDLSGNAKEWTSTDPAGGAVEYRIMGGSYNNPAGGLRCDFAFTVGEPDFHFPNVGFRCCSGVAP